MSGRDDTFEELDQPVEELDPDQEITMTRKAGSFPLEESLARLVHTGVLDRGDALLRAAHGEELESLLNARPST
jgi:hypothetical protein